MLSLTPTCMRALCGAGKLLHHLSNQGAEHQFDIFLEDVLTPAMARSANLGERECHIVCLSNEDLVEWDDELPPQ